LGVPAERLQDILGEHLVTPDYLRSDRWVDFCDDRRHRIHKVLNQTLTLTN
jgi:hypothetical protein